MNEHSAGFSWEFSQKKQHAFKPSLEAAVCKSILTSLVISEYLTRLGLIAQLYSCGLNF
jgi:hypothetical protein